MRGDDSCCRRVNATVGRFTPTCVGKTCGHASLPFRLQRFTPTCVGKTRMPVRLVLVTRGSPPHAWGQRSLIGAVPGSGCRFTPTCVGTTVDCHGVSESADSRFTPTCVGTTSAGRPLARPIRRFTPTCVGTTCDAGSRLGYGSPPHAWGHGCQGMLQRWRFTPTCVGTTVRSSHMTYRDPVHPHMRGDNYA